MNKKIRKTLYLPEWLADILDSEGEAYDGPGVVAAASIHSFSKMDKKNKISTLRNFRSKEIEIAYGSDLNDEDNKIQELEEPERLPRQRKPRSPMRMA